MNNNALTIIVGITGGIFGLFIVIPRIDFIDESLRALVANNFGMFILLYIGQTIVYGLMIGGILWQLRNKNKAIKQKKKQETEMEDGTEIPETEEQQELPEL